MGKLAALLVVLVVMSLGLQWLMSTVSVAGELLEQYFAALTLLIVLALLMPGYDQTQALSFSSSPP